MASGVKSGPECLEAFNCVHDVSWSRSVLEIGRLVKSVAEIEQVVADGSYDIVHVHTPIAGAVTRFALRHLRRRCRTKVVYTAHGFHFHPLGGVVRNAVYRSVERVAGDWTDALVVINRTDEEEARVHRIVPS